MGRMRKYPVSVGLSSDLIDIIEERTRAEGISRSRFIERLIRENIDDRCIQCTIEEKLRSNNIDTTFIPFPISMEEAEELIEEKKNRPTMRSNRERAILEIVRRITLESGKAADLNDVLTEVGRMDITQDVAMDIIDELVVAGQLMRPHGYETLAPV